MRRSDENRVIAAVLGCYPVGWRSRHGDEAAVIAAALLDDGTPWWSIAGSFLIGVARERAPRKPSVRIGSAVAALVLGIAAPLALFASLTPASASGTNGAIEFSKPGDVLRQLESAAANHHFTISVVDKAVPTGRVGSILSVRNVGASSVNAGPIREVFGRCTGGGSGCVVGLVLPRHYTGSLRVTIGAAASKTAALRDRQWTGTNSAG